MTHSHKPSKNPTLEHDTGKILAFLEGEWMRVPDLVKLKVEDGLFAEIGSSAYAEIKNIEGKLVLAETLCFDSFIDAKTARWQDLVSKELIFWVRTSPPPEKIPDFSKGAIVQKREQKLSPNIMYEELRLLNNIRFVDLTDADFLANHLDRIDEILDSYELTISPHLEMEVCNKLIQSLHRHESVQLSALTCLRIHGADWPYLKTVLKKRFCSKSTLVDSYKTRVKRLQWISFSMNDLEDFLSEATSLHSLLVQIGSTVEIGSLLREILGKLPTQIRLPVIRRLLEILPSELDWHEIPFSHIDALDEDSFCGLIEKETRIALQTTSYGPIVTPPLRTDRLNHIGEPPVHHQWILRGSIPSRSQLESLGFKDISKFYRKNGRSFQFVNFPGPLEQVRQVLKDFQDVTVDATKVVNRSAIHDQKNE